MQTERTLLTSRHAVRAVVVAGALVIGATVGRTSAAFTATAPVTGGATSGIVSLSTGGVQQLTFGGATLTNIGPGATFTQTVTVLNESTVTTPSSLTDIAVWGDITGTSTAASGPRTRPRCARRSRPTAPTWASRSTATATVC